MANRTVKNYTPVRGINPQYLIEKIVRERIYNCRYWQETCFLLNSALVLERAVDDVKYVGGTYGEKIDSTPFLCLALKLLQIQPKPEIIHLYIEQRDFKYLRALGAFYLRLTGKPIEIYKKLEPLYNDYRKLRIMDKQRKFSVTHMDEFIDDLLREEKVLNITLPRLPKRHILEENKEIELYRSELEEQNLIPTQLIEEKIELQLEEISRRNRSTRDRKESSSRERRHRSSHSPHHGSYRDSHRRVSSSHRHSASHKHYDDYRKSRHDSHNRDGHRSDRYRSRSRSRSPPQKKPSSAYEAKLSSKYSDGKGRFSREEIANENAIRARVGLKPLK